MKRKVSPAFESGNCVASVSWGSRGRLSPGNPIPVGDSRFLPGRNLVAVSYGGPRILPAELALNFFEFGDGQFLFAVNFFDSAGDCYFFATVAELFQLLAGVVLDDIIIDGFAILFGLDHTGAFLAFMERTHGTFGGAIDGDFFIIG